MTAPHLSRRSLLAGGAALAFAAACGGGDDGGGSDEREGSGGSTTAPASGGAASTLLALLPQQGVLTTNGDQRFPLAVAGADGVPVREGLPARQFQLRAESGDPEVFDVEPRSDGIPTPYYPVTFSVAEPGIYELTVVDEEFNPVTFEVASETAIPSVGQPLPAFDTPTTADPRGVTPICTREPACELHDVTLREALGSGSPVAFLVATPEFCQVSICGPVLDLLVEALADLPGVTGLHAEVYADPRGADDPTAGGLAPVTDAYSLPFEPTLFVADATGTITARLDSVYDRTELRSALEQVA
ncbi:MAG TPA: hypothetical protein VD926_13080 [Acidimicrobiales bacterium]|nr:hypothetical protein [Acidimicrobiales bacterium]